MSEDFTRRRGVPRQVSTRRELDDIVREVDGLLTALNDLDIAKLEWGRTIGMLEDAESIFEADARKRREELDKAIDAQEDMATENELSPLRQRARRAKYDG